MLSSCASGTKLLDEPRPGTPATPLTQASDENLNATLAWVIVRDGPGTWARNADWDEYQITLRAVPDANVGLLGVVLVDDLGTRIEPKNTRRQLVDGSRLARRRYAENGIEIRAGWNPAALAAAGAVAWYGVAAPLAVVAGSTATASIALGAVVVAPVLVISGVMRSVNNNRVDDEIQRRSTHLPMMLPADQDTVIDLFFPITPAPSQVEVSYSVNGIQHTVVIDTRVALAGLHLRTAD